MKINSPRILNKSMPKIGIRPTIDGRRRGIRESLEGQTMSMAKSVAEFLSKNIKHSNGMPVECVIADTTIGGVVEAAMAEEKFKREGVDLLLLLHLAGAMDQRLWIWTLLSLKQYGDLMEQSVQVQFTLLQF